MWFFVWLLAVGALWSILQPPFGVADETAHVTKAVATADLQLRGRTVIGDFGFQATEYSVPTAYAPQIGYIACYVNDVNASAACLGDLPTDRERITIASTAGHYQPTYYMLVGGWGLAFPGATGIYLMRLTSAVIFAGITAWAFSLAARQRSSIRGVGVLASVTPMAMAMAGAVNPHGLEIAAAILFWVAALIAIENANEEQEISRECLAASAVAGFAFATARPASFVWMLPIVVLILVFTGPVKSLRNLWSSTRGRLVVGLVGASILLSLVLHFASGLGTRLGGGSEAGSDSTFVNLETAFERADDYFRQMFGWFGWVEFYAPPFAFWASILMLGSIVGMMLVDATIRQWLTTFAALATVVVLPFLLEGLRAKESGFGYQGRYTLALAVGIPILASFALSKRDDRARQRNGTVTVLALSAFATFVCIDFALRRYTVGLAGPHIWERDPQWLPPGGLVLLGGLAGVAVAALVMTGVSLLRWSTSPSGRDDVPLVPDDHDAELAIGP